MDQLGINDLTGLVDSTIRCRRKIVDAVGFPKTGDVLAFEGGKLLVYDGIEAVWVDPLDIERIEVLVEQDQ